MQNNKMKKSNIEEQSSSKMIEKLKNMLREREKRAGYKFDGMSEADYDDDDESEDDEDDDEILPAGDPQTHTFIVKVDLPKTPGLKSGMFGRFQLDKGTSQTILVPASAVVERGELTSVFVVGTDRIARLRWIKAGRRFDQQREILSGVNAGERILMDGSRGVDGASVQILNPVAAPATP